MMNGAISDAELHAYIDGELPPQRAAAVEAAIGRDPSLAARVGQFRADKQAVSAAYSSLAEAAVPPALLSLALRGPSQPRSQPRFRRKAFMAAGVAAVAGSIILALTWNVTGDSTIEQALAARHMTIRAAQELQGQEFASIRIVDEVMSRMLGFPTRVPDLQRAGFKLIAAEIYGKGPADAVQLRYEDETRRLFTVFLRPSAGADAFKVAQRGKVRICVWQNADLTAVMTGEMPTPELFRLASLTYSSLNL